MVHANIIKMENTGLVEDTRGNILRKTPTREGIQSGVGTQAGSPPHGYPVAVTGSLARKPTNEDSTATLKQNSFLSTNRMSDVQSGSIKDENNFENYLPIIKRLPSVDTDLNLGKTSQLAYAPGDSSPESPGSPRSGVHNPCPTHPNKNLKYYDISTPGQKLCSKCVVELVVEKNFNAAMTKEGNCEF